MEMYPAIFLLYAGPYLCLFGIVIPVFVTALAFRILSVWTDESEKKIPEDQVKRVLVIVFIFAAMVSWGLIIFYFGDHPIMLD
jgi:hypothetical protein